MLAASGVQSLSARKLQHQQQAWNHVLGTKHRIPSSSAAEPTRRPAKQHKSVAFAAYQHVDEDEETRIGW